MDNKEARIARAYIELSAFWALSQVKVNIDALLAKRSIGEVLSIDVSALIGTIDELDLSEQTADCLAREGIVLIAELVEYTEDELLGIDNFGHRPLDEVRAQLAERGLNLNGESLLPLTPPSPALASTPLFELDLSTRPHNCLTLRRRQWIGGFAKGVPVVAPITTIEELCSQTEEDLLAITGFGVGCLQEVVEKLQARGLSLRPPGV